VADDCDGSGEVCLEGRTGFLVPLGNLDLLAECLEKLIRDPGLRERLGGAGREWVSERFRVETMVDALAALYERLGPRGGRPGAR
jgi:glycosyltransferase involved in cell wall biosynthesis